MGDDITGLEFTVKESGQGGKGMDMKEDEWYPAKLIALEAIEDTWKGEPVKKISWTFELQDEEFKWTANDGREGRFKLYGKTSYACSPKSTLYKWYSKLTGAEPEPGEKIVLKNILGIDCFVMIVINKGKTRDGEERIYFNIDKLKKGNSTSVQQKETQKQNPPEAKVQKEEIAPKVETKKQEELAPVATNTSSSNDIFDDIDDVF